MKTKIRLSDQVSFPIDLITESVSILAIKRAGKSTTARRMAEQIFEAGQQVVIIDPKGDWFGMRFARDGKAPGLPIVILGGNHADVPLESTKESGELVARLIVEQRVSLIIDMGDFRKYEKTRFCTFLLETLYRLKNKDEFKTPMMLVVDEADEVAPQRPVNTEGNLEPRLLGAVDDIVRRGGGRGIGITLITQRAAVLNKNVLTQTSLLVLLRTVADQDISAVQLWIEKHGTTEQARECLESLPSLPSGTAWFWSSFFPGGAGTFIRSQVEMPWTFDSSATPKVGERVAPPKNAAQVDLEAFSKEMAATVQRAAAEDPRTLQKRVRELEKELAKKAAAKTPAAPQIDLKAAVAAAERRGFDQAVAQLEAWRLKAGGRCNELFSIAGKIIAEPIKVIFKVSGLKISPQAQQFDTHQPIQQYEEREHSSRPVQEPRKFRPAAAPDSGSLSLPRGEHACLLAAAQFVVPGVDGITREQMTVMTGYKKSSRDVYIARLMAGGLLENSRGILAPTAAGFSQLGHFRSAPTAADLQQFWLARLPRGESVILQALIQYGEISRDQISDKTGYLKSSRDVYIARLARFHLINPDSQRGMVGPCSMLVE